MKEFKVGLLAIATMMSVAFMSFKITSNQSGFGDYTTYRTIVRDASGIFPKTPIKVAGISAGRILNIELQENNALITFEVLEKIKVTKDTRLRVKTVGFLGDKYLELFIGRSDEILLEMGLVIADEGGGVETLVRDASEVMKDVKDIVVALKESMAPEGQDPPIKKILDGVQEVIESTKSATASLNNIISGNEERLNNMIANFEQMSEDLAYHLDDTQKGSSMKDVKRILSNLDTMSLNLMELVADIRGGKGTMGKFLVEEDIADEVKQTLSSVRKIVGKVDSLKTELSVFTGANTDNGAETSASLKILPSPERFYLLGITTSEFGPESEKHTTTVDNSGSESVEIRREKEKDTYRFNIQLGRKIHNWSFRGGLIESTGGLGVDYDLNYWATRFTAEVFDYRDGIGVNLRVGSEIQLWNVIYGKMSLEDIIQDSRSATISAGLRFNDEDLKGLMGFFL